MHCVSLFPFQLNFSHFPPYFPPRLWVFFSSTTRFPILGGRWISPQAFHYSILYTPSIILPPFLGFLSFCGEKPNLLLVKKCSNVFVRANKIIPSIFGYLFPIFILYLKLFHFGFLGTSHLGRVFPLPFFFFFLFTFPLSRPRKKFSNCMD
ncbi:hypothetical protein HOY80DRAFT_327337 [Tuber brumale]|nr:hypothetical protein HOY80DRAFT_327337 [Tuber brumale]